MPIHNLPSRMNLADFVGTPWNLKDDASIKFGSGQDVVMKWDGTNLTFIPATDDTGQFIIGDGVKDMDLKIFMGSTYALVLFDNSAGQVEFDAVKIGEHWMKAPVAKTGNYNVLESDSGTHFTTEGASGAVEFTLPAVANAGFHAWFHQAEDQSMKVISDDASKMIVDGNVAATSVDFTTDTEHIGNCFYVISDGTKWLTINSPSAPHQAVNLTVA